MKINKEKACARLNVTEFEETVLSKALSRLPELSGGVWLAGGSVRRTFEGKKLDSDYDFFFKDKDTMDKFCTNLVDDCGASLVSENSKNKKFILPSKVVDVDDERKAYLPELEIQAINFKFFESAEDVIDSFDFTICQFAFDGKDFYIGDYSLWDLARKKLVIHKVTYGVATVRRLMKYANQGFTACGGCLTAVLDAVAKDPSVIQSDTLYID